MGFQEDVFKPLLTLQPTEAPRLVGRSGAASRVPLSSGDREPQLAAGRAAQAREGFLEEAWVPSEKPVR